MLFLWILGYFYIWKNKSRINREVRVIDTLIKNRYLY